MITIVGRTIPKNFGWVEDPVDARDVPFSASTFSSLSVGSGQVIDNAPYFKDISNQLNLPACVANAAADLMEAASIVDKCNAGMPLDQARAATPDLSRMFIWWNARNEMWPNATMDATSGTYNRLAMDVLARFGVCTEARWPYDTAKAISRPSIMSYREAIPNRFNAFYSIDSGGDGRVNAVIQALSAKHNVLFGTALTQSFTSYKSGVVRRPSAVDPIIGRHAMVICGWDPSKQAFKVRNSWNTSWGEAGYWWMHADYLTWANTKSLWVPTTGAL